MFRKKPADNTDKMRTEEIVRLYSELVGLDRDSKEYASTLEHIVKLNDLKPDKKAWRPSADAVVGAAATLLGIAAILWFEMAKNGVLTSKSLGFVPKPKIPNA